MNRAELLKISKPILFSTPMVRGILEGNKTVTRRVIKLDLGLADTDKTDSSYLKIPDKYGDYHDARDLCRYQVRDILYVRETWTVEGVEHEEDKWIAYIGYKAEGNTHLGYQTKMEIEESELEKYEEYLYGEADFKPSLHMPKKASRIFLKVSDVRVERLQDITEDGAEKEMSFELMQGLCAGFTGDYRTAFTMLWNSTVKKADLDKYSWEANPWVWVIEFERMDKPND